MRTCRCSQAPPCDKGGAAFLAGKALPNEKGVLQAWKKLCKLLEECWGVRAKIAEGNQFCERKLVSKSSLGTQQFTIRMFNSA